MGVKYRRLIMVLIAVALIVIPTLVALPVWQASGTEQNKAPVTGMQTVPDGTEDDLDGFATNLPIVIMDVGGKALHVHSVWDNASGHYLPVDYDPHVGGTLAIIDTGTGVNRLSDPRAEVTTMKARMRGSSSQTFPKPQYAITLVNGDGADSAKDMLGMGTSANWVLNVSFLDKSLLRNYLAYTVAAQVMAHTPKARYCELFFADHGTFQYQGVYLLMQSIEAGASMVPLAPYDARHAEAAYLLRRDRYRPGAIMLNTYGTVNQLTDEYLEVRYPGAGAITPATIDYITTDVSAFEKALFAPDDKTYLTYRDYVDVNSFVDYFVLNEFFANYDAALHSMYMYHDLGGKLTMGPVWDFDRAIDNDYPRSLKVDSTAMDHGVWFAEVLRDGDFVKQVLDRYHQLRKGVLSDASLDALIDRTVSYLGTAQVRDWNRWNYNGVYDEQFVHEVPIDQRPLTKNRLDYAGTVAELTATLHDHGAWMDAHLDSLYQFSTIRPGQYATDYSWILSALAVVLVVAFFTTVHLAQRER